MLFDSEFLIAASGQRGAPRWARAEAFLRAHLDAPLYTSRICWAEFAEGCVSQAETNQGTARFTIVEISEPVAWEASRLARLLKPAGLHIGDNDVWIAATALAYGLPLVSRNVRHFSRVPGLTIATY
ncbi:MAG: type II toxin-antitoxin system VapC family toxin [Opitutae bacterium]|nr:type II toxin-antitoxin system VapC family toxin [Opitutae bacterium]